MPIVAHSDLPTFERLRQEGEAILEPSRALQQDIRELHIGLLNMMPDAALAATERQFFRLVGESNQIAQFYVHPFTVPQLPRSDEGRAYTERYYESFEQIRREGLDALIITGANVTQPNLAAEPFWEPLIEVIDWAYNNVTSTLCSCLATHAVMQFLHDKKRYRLPAKRWCVSSSCRAPHPPAGKRREHAIRRAPFPLQRNQPRTVRTSRLACVGGKRRCRRASGGQR